MQTFLRISAASSCTVSCIGADIADAISVTKGSNDAWKGYGGATVYSRCCVTSPNVLL